MAANKFNMEGAIEVAKLVHYQIGKLIGKVMAADDKPVNEFEVLLASFAGQLSALTSSVLTLREIGTLTTPLAADLETAIVALSSQLTHAMFQSKTDNFAKRGHCGTKGFQSCDAKEAEAKKALPSCLLLPTGCTQTPTYLPPQRQPY